MSAIIKELHLNEIPKKPTVLPVLFDNIPASLRELKDWLMWRHEWRDARWTKVPLQPNGRRAKVNDPATYAPLPEVKAAYESGRFDGIGIVLRGGLVGIDIDHVIHGRDEIEPWAKEILERFAGTYIEYSPSRMGFHILVRGKVSRCGKAGPGNRLEFYDESSARYFTVTGHRYG